MTQIICVSGRKQSGKNTSINFIIGMHMHAAGIVKESFGVDDKGRLVISDIFGDTEYAGIFDVNRNTPSMQIFLADNLNEFVKTYSFADLLKEDICMKVLGLTYEQCFGTDEQKNTATHLLWEDMPGIAAINANRTGQMTAREVMQYVGTNIFRRMYNNVWVDATIRRIKDEGTGVALISDCRFPNEVEGVQKAGGKVIRFTRNPHPEDNHPSETALDEDKFDWSKFDAVIDNKNMSITEQNDEIYKVLKNWNMTPIELDI